VHSYARHPEPGAHQIGVRGSTTSEERLTGQVKLVSSLTRSGSSRGQSDSIVDAIRLRLEDAGYHVGGVPLVYEDLDGGSEERGSWDPEREAANARYAAGDPDVVAYIATLDTDAAPYSIPITNQAGPLLQISPCNTYPGLTRPFEPGEPDVYYPTGVRSYARTAMSDDLQGLFAAQWALELGAQRIAVLHDGEPCGRGVAEPFGRSCAQLGLELVEPPVAIVPKQAQYRDLAAMIVTLAPDLVFYGGIIQNGAGPLWHDVRTALPAATMMGADTLFEHAFIEDAGEHAEGTLITFGGVPPALLEGRGRDFFERYVETYGHEPECYAASAYDAISVVLAAVEQVGSKDRGAITRAALATRDFDGLLGRWSFDSEGDIDLRRATRLTVRDGGFSYLEVREIEQSAARRSRPG
jgi:branched-chain amino acid transport system substrate-binding protein